MDCYIRSVPARPFCHILLTEVANLLANFVARGRLDGFHVLHGRNFHFGAVSLAGFGAVFATCVGKIRPLIDWRVKSMLVTRFHITFLLSRRVIWPFFESTWGFLRFFRVFWHF